ncbi:M16 family metallopeptidase [Thalassotalea crassostreae]|uniref:M16 family metallopeptidase n=1 Tax=Thalassotalea crassostreae TaxID=1763536 RepID=UPI0008397852|nr:pitrilysin family protein [Thalassotalea crassostreae]
MRNVEGIDEYMLQNGMKVLFYPDPSQPKTLVNVTYRVGSRHEYYGETGMAHLLEHMLFKGSTNYKSIDKEFKKRGMGKNASTWLDRTNYFETFDANEDSLEWAIGMEADRMVNATFTEEDLKSEMTVVRNEMERNETNSFRMLMARMSSTAFIWHNYGNSTIGARSDVENFPFQRLREFYKKHYRPDNAVVTIAGRFDKEKTKALVEKHFGAIAKPEKPIEPLYTVEPTQDGERTINIRRVGNLPIVGLSYHTPSALHAEAGALQILTEILGDATRGRLQKSLVEKGIATSASNFTFDLKDSSQFLLFVEGNKDSDIAVMEDELINIVENLKDNPITQQEVDLAKAKMARQIEQALRSVTGVGMALSEYISLGDYRQAFYSRDVVARTTLEQVQAAEKYLIRSNRTVGRFIPTEKPVRAEIPAAPDLTELLKDFKGNAVATAGEVYDNTVANIKNRLIKSQWAEGTKINVYPKVLRGEQIIIKMHFPSGTAENLAYKGSAIGYVGALLKKGNAKYSKEEIVSKLDQLKSSINIATSAGSTDVAISTDKSNLDATIALFGEIMAAPTFPGNELEVMKRSSIARIESERNDPSKVAGNSFKEALANYPKGHPKAYMTLDERIAATKAITSSELESLYRSHTNIVNGHIAIVGDVDSDKISAQLHKQLSGFVNDTEYEYMTSSMKQTTGLTISTETPDKANAQLYIINPITMNVNHEDYLALKMATTIFGGDSFSSRIGARIRVKEGYSYTVGAGMQVNSLDTQGMYYAAAISAPENMDNVVAAYKEEAAKVVADGFTAEELDQAVKGFISSRNHAWASDEYIAGVLQRASKLDEDLGRYDQQIEDVQKLTLEDVNAAFNKYIGSLDINAFKAGDFAKLKK